MPHLNKQSGSIAGVLLVAIGLMTVIIAAIALMSRYGSYTPTKESESLSIDVLLRNSAEMQTGMERMANDGFDPRLIQFSQDPAKGALYSGSRRPYTLRFLAPASIASTQYYYHQNISLPAQGTAAPDRGFVVRLKSLKQCQRINTKLYGDPPAGTPARSTANIQTWMGNAAINDNSATAVNYAGRPEGCVLSSEGAFMYYKLVFSL